MGHGFGYLDAAAHSDKIHIGAFPVQEDVSHISPHDIALTMEAISSFTHQSHDGQIDVLGYFFTVNFHFFCFLGCKITAFFALFLLMLPKISIFAPQNGNNCGFVA